MSLKTYSQLLSQIDEIRNETAIGGNTRQRVAQVLEDMLDSTLVYAGTWNHATQWPTALKKGIYYERVGDFGAPGDPVYIPDGAWIISIVDGANDFSGYTIKI